MRCGSLLCWLLPVAAADDGCSLSSDGHLEMGADPLEVTLLQQVAKLGRSKAEATDLAEVARVETAALSDAFDRVTWLAEHDAEIARNNAEISVLLQQSLEANHSYPYYNDLVGTEENNTMTARGALGAWTPKYGWKTFVDIACGEANWQGFIPNLNYTRYYGLDIAESILEVAKQNNAARPYMSFDVLDVTKAVPMRGDVAMMRDVIQYLPMEVGFQAIKNVKASGTRYLVATTYPRGRNHNVFSGLFYSADLGKDPFFLPEPLESCTDHDSTGFESWYDSDHLLEWQPQLSLFDLTQWNIEEIEAKRQQQFS